MLCSDKSVQVGETVWACRLPTPIDSASPALRDSIGSSAESKHRIVLSRLLLKFTDRPQRFLAPPGGGRFLFLAIVTSCFQLPCVLCAASRYDKAFLASRAANILARRSAGGNRRARGEPCGSLMTDFQEPPIFARVDTVASVTPLNAARSDSSNLPARAHRVRLGVAARGQAPSCCGRFRRGHDASILLTPHSSPEFFWQPQPAPSLKSPGRLPA